MLKLSLTGGLIAMAWLLGTTATHGQASQLSVPQTATQNTTPTSISPLELQQFAQSIKQLQVIELEMQQKMAQAIQKEGLSPERFLEIEQKIQDPYAASSTPEISEDEMTKYRAAVAKIQEIAQEVRPKQERAIATQGLAIQRFAQISQMVNRDRTLQQRVQQMIGTPNPAATNQPPANSRPRP